ncbi:hypothetical protein OIE69_43850 (plasmid) [Actinacidiphila glaucinigra]|uniref:hypothetical protein n=1 Tax=Actinacidiphila glaucinigra TaxID=235986 RepID=UPI002DDA396C|nr:hypothetical protein [Actinacidiphila glaucinigra]WSD65840.1 hypothetical protein OIE69_43850 [Actinacidiphila glaucinigra]
MTRRQCANEAAAAGSANGQANDSNACWTDLLASTYERHAGRLQAYISKRLTPGLRQDAEDVASEVWLRCAEATSTIDRRILDFSWLQLMAHAAVRAHLGESHSGDHAEAPIAIDTTAPVLIGGTGSGKTPLAKPLQLT